MVRRTPVPAAQLEDTADPQIKGGGHPPQPKSDPTPGDLAAALLELLRKLNSELPDGRPLKGRALTAVANFQEISADLATLADVPASNFSTLGSRSA